MDMVKSRISKTCIPWNLLQLHPLGNSQDFGDQQLIEDGQSWWCSFTNSRCISAGDPSPFNNTRFSLEIPSTGNAVDFGDLTRARSYVAGCSNGHGGL